MTQEFIPYEQALKLKELGFDEPCIGKWLSNLQSNWKEYTLVLEMGEDNRNAYLLEGACSAPLYQQAFRWFREKYNLLGYVSQATISKDKVFMFTCNEGNDTLVEDIDSDFKTYEEAELVCLKNLIEIVKNK